MSGDVTAQDDETILALLEQGREKANATIRERNRPHQLSCGCIFASGRGIINRKCHGHGIVWD